MLQIVIDGSHRIVGSSGDIAHFTGLTHDVARGKFCYDVITSDLCFSSECPFKSVTSEQTSYSNKSVRMINDDGSWREVEYAIHAGCHGRKSGVIVTISSPAQPAAPSSAS